MMTRPQPGNEPSGTIVKVTVPSWITVLLQQHGFPGIAISALCFFLWHLVTNAIPQSEARFIAAIKDQRETSIRVLKTNEDRNQANSDRLEKAIEKLSTTLEKAVIRPKSPEELEAKRP